jgi:hypothetical protein
MSIALDASDYILKHLLLKKIKISILYFCQVELKESKYSIEFELAYSDYLLYILYSYYLFKLQLLELAVQLFIQHSFLYRVILVLLS